MSLIKSELLEILVCPADKADLVELKKEEKLECTKCGRKYPVRDGIPVMLIDEAEMPKNPRKNKNEMEDTHIDQELPPEVKD